MAGVRSEESGAVGSSMLCRPLVLRLARNNGWQASAIKRSSPRSYQCPLAATEQCSNSMLLCVFVDCAIKFDSSIDVSVDNCISLIATHCHRQTGMTFH
ncbi:hypothetical protein ACLKA6_001725 [Drosophila palustris]